jgi:endoglucanase
VKPLLANASSDVVAWLLTEYRLEGWGRDRIHAEIAFAADWAKRRNVPLTCNEFGVYRRFSEPPHRTAWLTDVREAFEKHGIGWTMWDYRGGFGVVTKTADQTTPDADVLKALSLQK